MNPPGNLGEVVWGVSPPLDRQPYVPILSPGPGRTITGVILSDALVGVFTHWYDGRTVPCYHGPGGVCALCQWAPRRWKGYVALLWNGTPRQGMAEITLDAVRGCPRLADKDVSLRGLRLVLQRKGRVPNGPVTATVSPSPFQIESLPVPFTVQDALLRIWSGNEWVASAARSAAREGGQA